MREQRRPNWWVLATVGVGTFMSALDGSVVNVILPVLRNELRSTFAGIECVTTVFLVVVSGLLLGMGRAGDLYGQKRLYIGGFLGFAIGSMLCGMAPSAPALIALRGLQAVGASMLFAIAPAILARSFPPELRGRVLDAQGTMAYLGLTVGPTFGGWLAQVFGWRWVFAINVPVGAFALALAIRSVSDDRPERQPAPFDFARAGLFGSGLVTLHLALNRGEDWGSGRAATILTLSAAVASLASFVFVERRRRSPMLDLSLFANAIFSGATMSALLNYVCVYSVLFVVSFLLIQGMGMNTQQAGEVLTAQPLVMAIAAPISGALSDNLGSRLLASLGMAFLAAGLLALGLLAASRSVLTVASSLAVIEFGVGIFVSPNNRALIGAAPDGSPGHRLGCAGDGAERRHGTRRRPRWCRVYHRVRRPIADGALRRRPHKPTYRLRRNVGVLGKEARQRAWSDLITVQPAAYPVGNSVRLAYARNRPPLFRCYLRLTADR